MSNLLQDLRYSIRILVRRPLFSVAVILMLALGIGANATIFGFINGLLLKPLPVEEPDRVMSLYGVHPDGSRATRFSHSDYSYYRENNDAFTELAAHAITLATLGRGEEAQPLLGEIVSGNYFTLLGVGAFRGRIILPEDDDPAAASVAVLGYTCWQRRFGSDPTVVGRAVFINGEPYTVIGVARESFKGTQLGPFVDVWLPVETGGKSLGPDWKTDREKTPFQLKGRLKVDHTPEQAQAKMDALAANIARIHGESDGAQRIELARASLIGGQRRGMIAAFSAIILIIAALVLAVALANVANLVLARAVGRRRETAIRQALGASRFRLIRYFVTENLLLALLGGGAGLLISLWAGNLLFGFNPLPDFPIEFDIAPDQRVVGFTLFVSLISGIALGFAPALQVSRLNLIPALKGGDQSGQAHRSRLRSVFVIAQVALSLVLLIGAGLLSRSLRASQAVDPGFDPDNVIAMDFDLDLNGFSEERGKQFYQTMVERIEALPGIESATLANRAPVDISTPRTGVLIEGHLPPPGRSSILISSYIVGPEYFQTMKIPLIEGRAFNDQDREGAPGVALVNETMARRYWPDENAVGKRFALAESGAGEMRMDAGSSVEIIGVVKDSKYRTLSEDPTPFLYLPHLQRHQQSMTLLARTEGEPNRFLGTLRAEIQSLEKGVQGFFARNMFEHMRVALLPARIAATLTGLFGLVALLLATLGIYGVVSYSISQRTREIGIRQALGARRRDVLKLVVGQGMSLVAVGLALGLCCSLVLARFLENLLFGVSSSDPLTYFAITLLLAVVAFVACYIPARRATRVDPMVALRYE